MDARFQGNLYGPLKWEPRSCAGIYPFRALLVALVLNQETGRVLNQFHVVFDDEFSTFPFMREGTIPPNCTYLVQHRSQSNAPENIYLSDTWFTPDLE